METRVKQCSLCHREADDSIDVECGNNAEYSITLNLCAEHLKESETLGYGFDQKYGAEIEKMNNERWC